MPVTPGEGDTVDPGVATPVYRQLADILRARILSGAITPGHVIPSEKQLQQELGVSRNTSRRSAAILRDEGLVVTVAGRGTYVVSAAELDRYRREHE
jgi:DNA-binding GntR family transcriptional regulator